MKRALLTTAIVSLAAVGLVTVVPAAARAAATVVNPGFNQGGGTTTPPGWSTFSPNGTASASYTEATSNGYGGDAYELTHWSSAAYTVDTYQTITGLSAATTRSASGRAHDTGDGCTASRCPAAAARSTPPRPVDSDGSWVHIVDLRPRHRQHCTIDCSRRLRGGAWTNYNEVTFTPGSAPIAIRGGDVSSLVPRRAGRRRLLHELGHRGERARRS